MRHHPTLITRRQALAWTAAAPFLLTRPALAVADTGSNAKDSACNTEFADLERAHDRRLGLHAVDTASGKEIAYRAGERFPFCSSFKAVLAAAVLARDARQPGVLDRRISYTRHDLAPYSPVTQNHAGDDMRVADLCAATLRYSDNTAANLLLHLIGGPPALTAFARAAGNASFRLDRYETALNTAIPGDPRDTSTPRDMGVLLRALMLGDALPARAQATLADWMLGNRTGDRRIRAATPADWKVADKTGTGDYASASDIGVLWPPGRRPIVLAIYTTARDSKAKADEDLIAAASRIALRQLA
ncbi:class A beta-lactamase [Bordetella genomosp. 8]|uniref:class A beta-lactamase n=1 Tax=Bordetella genomosp. 8 TaxID=1416806 RepID=UPI003B27FC4C